MNSGIRSARRGLCLVALLLLGTALQAGAVTVTWSGGGGISWATGSSWSVPAGPGTGDTASFSDTGASTLPGEVTSLVNADRTINGLAFNDTSTKFHTLDLGTHNLTITGNLNFNLDQSAVTTTTVRNGVLTANGAFSTLNVGRAVSGSSKSIVDLSGVSSLTAALQDVNIGVSTASSAEGTLTLSPSNSITAQNIYIGASNGTGDTKGTLRLGLTNTLATPDLVIGKDNSTGLVTIVNNGVLNLGSASQRSDLFVGNGNVGSDQLTYTGKLDLTGGTFNAFIGNLIVGQKDGNSRFGYEVGTLIGGSHGSIDIGAAGNTANFYVGRMLNGGGNSSVAGSVNFAGLSTLTANLDTLGIGTQVLGTGGVTGNATLAQSNTINAKTIIVGAGVGGGPNVLNLGKTNAILANQWIIGQDQSNGTVSLPSGGALTLGSAAQRTDLFIGTGTITGSAFYGKLDLTGSSFNGYLGQLIVGQRDGSAQFGDELGTLIGGNSGSINIGATGNTANVYIGRILNGGTNCSATGSVDFGGLDSLNANLNTLGVGTFVTGSTAAGATGALTLAQTNTISAKTIVIGDGGNGNDVLNLGRTNTFLTNALTIGHDNSNSAVQIIPGGTLSLGSPAQKVALSIGAGNTSTNVNPNYNATFDLTGGSLIAYLDGVTIGGKNAGQPGSKWGSFTISTRADNHVEAGNILIATGSDSTGILNFGGGALIANTISAGGGSASFNWTGGRLSVGTFGTATANFALKNTGTGTLAPGSSASPIGTTNVFGAYTQSAGAALEIDIAGSSPAAGNDLLNVSGSATLAGTLNLKTLNNFVPAAGQNFLIATYASRTGTFAFVSPPKLPQDVAFTLDYTSDPTQLVVHTVAPTVANYISPAAAGNWGTAGNWDTAAVPGTTTAASLVNSGGSAKTVTVAASTTVHRVVLQGASAAAPMNLEVLAGVRFGVANQLVVGSNAALTGGGQVIGDVVVGGGAALAPGSLPAAAPVPGVLQVSGDLTTQTASTFYAAIGGANPGTGYDQVAVGGNANLSGNLAVRLINGFSPAPLERFDVLTYASRSGLFTSASGMSAGGQMVFATIYDSDRLSLVATLPGDANVDGVVGFADLVAVAQHYGATNQNWSSGDFNYDDVVDFADLVAVAQHYGNSLAPPASVPGASAEFNEAWAAAQSSVPEPAALALVLLTMPVMLLGRRRARSV